jgi:DNA-binding NarL/FixJ family response regulator
MPRRSIMMAEEVVRPVLQTYPTRSAALFDHPSDHVSSHERQVVRMAAAAAVETSVAKTDLRTVWHELTTGRYVVLDGFFSRDGCYLLLSSERGVAPGLSGRKIEILAAILGGQRQKVVAIDMKLSPSAIASRSRDALRAIGTDVRPGRVHPVLMLAARATSEGRACVARCATFALNDTEFRVLAVPQPDRTLIGVVPAAELEVIRGLVQGLSHAELARRRGTSVRTIANQVSAVFARLRVSSRAELVHRLFPHDGSVQRPSLPHPVTRPSELVSLRAERAGRPSVGLASKAGARIPAAPPSAG